MSGTEDFPYSFNHFHLTQISIAQSAVITDFNTSFLLKGKKTNKQKASKARIVKNDTKKKPQKSLLQF